MISANWYLMPAGNHLAMRVHGGRHNGYQAAAFLFSDPQFLVFFFFTLALLLLYFWGTVQQREAARESILSKNTELGAAHKFSYGWAGVSLEPVFGSCTCNETPIKKRGEGRTESE